MKANRQPSRKVRAMPDNATFVYYDYDEEVSKTEVAIAPLTAVNFAASATAITTLRDAIQGLLTTGGLVSKTNQNNVIQDLGKLLPNSPLAQREIKWMVIAVPPSDPFSIHKFELPMANLALLENRNKYLVRGGIVVVTTPATVTLVNAFITAFEAVAVDAVSEEALEIVSIQQVGRNL